MQLTGIALHAGMELAGTVLRNSSPRATKLVKIMTEVEIWMTLYLSSMKGVVSIKMEKDSLHLMLVTNLLLLFAFFIILITRIYIFDL